jgi:hypothetical protein
MGWSIVRQGAPQSTGVRVSLSEFGPSRQVRLCVSLSEDVRSALGWAPDEALGLRVGVGSDLGKVQLYPVAGGALLVRNPRGKSYQARLRPGDMLGQITAASLEAEADVVTGAGRSELHILLPWPDLEESLAAAQAMAAA